MEDTKQQEGVQEVDQNHENPENPEQLQEKQDLFQDLSAENSFTEMESLCMNCHEQGTTRLLLTRIPFFKEIILMAFTCPHCGFKSNEVQPGGEIQEKGVRYELKVQTIKDVSRQIVKSDSASITLPDLQFEIPASTQRGTLNTIEGFLLQSVDALQALQEDRRRETPDTAQKIDDFIVKLQTCARGDTPFTLVLDDPAGNSFIENPYLPKEDANLSVSHYKRTVEQDLACGLTPHQEEGAEPAPPLDPTEKEVLIFPGSCPDCGAKGETRMVMTGILPFEVVLMAFTCEECGYKTNEVKCGGAISEKGRHLELKITSPDDLSRDVLKSETAYVNIPECDLELGEGTLGGRFTSIEGLLTLVKDEFANNPFIKGDSANPANLEHYNKMMESLKSYIEGKENFTLIMDDPLANSYIQNIYAPDPDPNMVVRDYERTFEQNDNFGLNDMKTENY